MAMVVTGIFRAVLQDAFGGRHRATHAGVELKGHPQRAAEGLEDRFALVVGVDAAQIVDMQGDQGVIDQALEEFAGEVDVEVADARARERDVVFVAGGAEARRVGKEWVSRCGIRWSPSY